MTSNIEVTNVKSFGLKYVRNFEFFMKHEGETSMCVNRDICRTMSFEIADFCQLRGLEL